jgi:hypothetical protein
MGRRTWSALLGRLRPWPGRAWERQARRTKNPLLRTPTLRERIVAGLGLTALFVAAAGVVGVSVYVYANGRTLERQQAAARSVASATVDTQPTSVSVAPTGSVLTFASVRYRWRDVDHEGIIPVAATARLADPVSVWVDSAGQLTEQPRTHTQTTLETIEAAALGVAVLGAVGYGGVIGYQRWSLRRRSGLWDDEWLHFVVQGPGSGR